MIIISSVDDDNDVVDWGREHCEQSCSSSSTYTFFFPIKREKNRKDRRKLNIGAGMGRRKPGKIERRYEGDDVDRKAKYISLLLLLHRKWSKNRVVREKGQIFFFHLPIFSSCLLNLYINRVLLRLTLPTVKMCNGGKINLPQGEKNLREKDKKLNYQ